MPHAFNALSPLVPAHENNVRHFQCGDRVRARLLFGDAYKTVEGEVVGWWEGAAGRHPRVRFEHGELSLTIQQLTRIG